mgnify:CR=1 FL=1
MRMLFVYAAFVLLAGAVSAGPDRPAPDSLRIFPGDPEDRAPLGFGWGPPERDRDFTFAWLEHHEGDLWMARARRGDAVVTVKMFPYYLTYRQQRVALYVNGRLAGETIVPRRHDWVFREHRFTVPATYWREGRNRLILRCAYVGRHRGRNLALAVQWVEVRPIP